MRARLNEPGPNKVTITKRLIRTALTNGSELNHADQHSPWVRRLHELAQQHTNHLGGEVSHAEAILVKRAAMLTLQLEFIEHRWANNNDGVASLHELDQYQ